jgi:DNA (cytosine-5)-methyltransferase 3A
LITEPIQVGSLPRPNGELSTSQAMRIYAQDGKSITQSAGGGGLGGKTGLYAIPVEFEDSVPTKAVSRADGKTHTVYKVVDGLITIKGKEYPIKLIDGYYIIRKLTVRECARLQTMPDDYCKAVSDSQAYKALGNGWTAEVIIHLLNHALKDVPRDEEIVVLSMYDGIATGRYCLDKMGFTNVTYHAYETDKYPITVAMDNYPDIFQHGDAFAVREDDWQPPQTRSEWLDELLGDSL